jgi:hypothetical protein
MEELLLDLLEELEGTGVFEPVVEEPGFFDTWFWWGRGD